MCRIGTFTILVILRLCSFLQAVNYEISLEKIEHNSEVNQIFVDTTGLKVVRQERMYVISGGISIKKDLDDSVEFSGSSAYSALGNNQFVEQPYKLPQTPFCEFFNTTYKQYVEPHLLGKTNLPEAPPEGLCPLPMGEYSVENVILYEEVFPDNLPEGLWKLSIKLQSGKDIVGGVHIYGKITKKLPT